MYDEEAIDDINYYNDDSEADNLDEDEIQLSENIDYDSIDLLTAQVGKSVIHDGMEDLEEEMKQQLTIDEDDDAIDTESIVTDIDRNDVVEYKDKPKKEKVYKVSDKLETAFQNRLRTVSMFEFTRIILERYNQLITGAKPMVNTKHNYIVDILIDEINEKRVPYEIHKNNFVFKFAELEGIDEHMDKYKKELDLIRESEN